MSDTPSNWPPPPQDDVSSSAVGSASRRRFRPPQRHAHWIDHEHTEDEPREDSPRLLWWILAGLLAFAVLSVMIRMFLAS